MKLGEALLEGGWRTGGFDLGKAVDDFGRQYTPPWIAPLEGRTDVVVALIRGGCVCRL